MNEGVTAAQNNENKKILYFNYTKNTPAEQGDLRIFFLQDSERVAASVTTFAYFSHVLLHAFCEIPIRAWIS